MLTGHLPEVKNTKKGFKPLSIKAVEVAYENLSLRVVPTIVSLPENIRYFGREVATRGGRLQEVVAQGGSTVLKLPSKITLPPHFLSPTS